MKKKIFGMFTMVLSILCIPTIIMASEAKIGDTEYDSLADAYSAATAGDKIVLLSDANLSGTLTVSKNLTIDLNGHDIIASNKVININGAKLELTGSGTVKESAPYYGAIHLVGTTDESITDYSHVVVGKDVTLEAWAPIFISFVPNTNKACGVVADIYGTLNSVKDIDGYTGHGIYINGTVQNKTCYPVINVKDGAVITSEGAGIYAAGYGEFNIGAANITGFESGIAVKSGTINLTNTNIKSTGPASNPTGNNNGINESGAAIQIESNPGYAGDIKININGGNYESENGHAIIEYASKDTVTETSVSEFKITDGNFISAEDSDTINVSDLFKRAIPKFIEGGTYSSDVADYVLDDLDVKVVNGKYVVGDEDTTVSETTNTTATNTNKSTNNEIKNPNTLDNKASLIIIMIVSSIVLITTFTILKRKYNRS